jgi:hypothetical protein
MVKHLKNSLPWLSSALDDVARLAALPPDWDGYGSPQLGATEREHAIQLLASIDHQGIPAPNIVPISGGGIQIEWQHNRRELELEIVPGAAAVLFLKVHEDDTTEEGAFPLTDRHTMRKLLAWLCVG